MTTLLIIGIILFYIFAGVLIAFIAGFCGVNISKPKNIFLIVFYPIGMWFLK